LHDGSGASQHHTTRRSQNPARSQPSGSYRGNQEPGQSVACQP
jgi:hypothetical protein